MHVDNVSYDSFNQSFTQLSLKTIILIDLNCTRLSTGYEHSAHNWSENLVHTKHGQKPNCHDAYYCYVYSFTA